MNYYHIIGIRSRVDETMHAKLSLDFVIQYDDNDIKKGEYLDALLKDQLFKTDVSTGLEITGLNKLNSEIFAAKLRTKANMLTVHKLVTEFEMDMEDLITFVDSCNIIEDHRKKLNESRINF